MIEPTLGVLDELVLIADDHSCVLVVPQRFDLRDLFLLRADSHVLRASKI